MPKAAQLVRRLARQELALWGIPPDQGDSAVTALNELVTNAIDHNPNRRFWVSLSYTPPTPTTTPSPRAVLLIEVSDQHLDPPVRRATDQLSESGRGLHMVTNLANDWGYRYQPDEAGTIWKIVWAALHISPPATTQPPAPIHPASTGTTR
ncbi:ATP-binding protein [Actinomadura hibisca]|uniref:ATP-binding protein n=1 Tax=Actinomadura hibisca TaxID=68565 RepID=UPI000833301A|nr:ATP-binding protein [Actinomadura hibisca]